MGVSHYGEVMCPRHAAGALQNPDLPDVAWLKNSYLGISINMVRPQEKCKRIFADHNG